MSTATFEIVPLKVEAVSRVTESNVDQFLEALRTWVATINSDPKTDEDFGQAEIDVKKLKETRDLIKTGYAEIMEKATDINQLIAKLREGEGEVTKLARDLEKQVNAAKDRIRESIVDEAFDLLECPASQKRSFRANLEAAIKNKKKLDKMRSAVSDELMVLNARFAANREILDQFAEEHGAHLIADRDLLEVKSSTEIVQAELNRRVEVAEHEAEKKKLQEEAMRERLKREDAEKTVQSTPATPEPDLTDSPFLGLGRPKATIAPKTLAQSEVEEWDMVKKQILEAFAVIKPMRGKLRHARNNAKLDGLAVAINHAWKQWA